MSPIQYSLIILLCIPVFIAIDQHRIFLGLIFWGLLMLPLALTALLPELQLRSELQWLVCLGELYWLRKTTNRSTSKVTSR